jgi:hypothetical protein
MARSVRGGLSDPVTFFESLRPARQACIEQLRSLRPFGPDYHMLSVVISGLDAAAEYFTKRRSFYVTSNPDVIGWRAPPDA